MNEIITEDYYEGAGCTCYASSANECGCEGADWTPKEVYDLRGEVMALKALAESTANLAKSLKAERDEARDAIVGWENKWKCAIDMAARAELEREDAKDLAQQMSESNQVLQAEVRDYRKKERATS